MISIKEAAAAELARRLAEMSTEDLITVMGVRMRRRRASAAPPARSRSTPPQGQLTVAAAVLQATQSGALTSNEIVAEAQRLRPGTAEPTIRAEISRMHAGGRLKRAPGGGSVVRFRAA